MVAKFVFMKVTIMSHTLSIFARITPKTEFYSAAKLAIINILPQTRAESGCLAFNLYEDHGDAHCLYLHEIWNDKVALGFHHAQPYTREVFVNYEDWLASPVEITELRAVDITD